MTTPRALPLPFCTCGVSTHSSPVLQYPILSFLSFFPSSLPYLCQPTDLVLLENHIPPCSPFAVCSVGPQISSSYECVKGKVATSGTKPTVAWLGYYEVSPASLYTFGTPPVATERLLGTRMCQAVLGSSSWVCCPLVARRHRQGLLQRAPLSSALVLTPPWAHTFLRTSVRREPGPCRAPHTSSRSVHARAASLPCCCAGCVAALVWHELGTVSQSQGCDIRRALCPH